MSASRGTLPRGTKWSSDRIGPETRQPNPRTVNRSVEENLDLLERMKNGEFAEGSRVLRAKIDMAHPNLVMRTRSCTASCASPTTAPAIVVHQPNVRLVRTARTTRWKASRIRLCSQEYIIHRPLYESVPGTTGEFKTRQIEFSRLNLTYAMMSKRKLRKLVEAGIVSGWTTRVSPRCAACAGAASRRGHPDIHRHDRRNK